MRSLTALLLALSLAGTNLLLALSQAGTDLLTQAPPTLPSEQAGAPSVTSLLRRFEKRNAPYEKFLETRPTLVVCDNGDEAVRALAPAIANFTIVRLNKGEKPPPWNHTDPVFLHFNKCIEHPYVKEAKERRRNSPYLVAPRLPPPAATDEGEGGAWLNGVRFPSFAGNATPYLRVARDRPILLRALGEVFWRDIYRGQRHNDVDLVVYRERSTPVPGCLTAHWVQGVAMTAERGVGGEFGLRKSTAILEGTAANPHKPPKAEYEKFCSFVTRRDPMELVRLFNTTYYDTDALVRYLFFRQLGEHRPCEWVTGCPGSPQESFRCMVGYKFHITMDNTNLDGYVSEKLFNGALGGGIPIYFGADDVGRYVNERSFVRCAVSPVVIAGMRSLYPRTTRPRLWHFDHASSWPTEEELYAWADEHLRPQLEPCVRRVVELDGDDAEYMRVLNEPFVVDKDIMSGAYPLRGLALAYGLLAGPAEALGGDFAPLPPVPGNDRARPDEILMPAKAHELGAAALPERVRAPGLQVTRVNKCRCNAHGCHCDD